MGRPGTFKKGNKAALGNPGPGISKKRFITDAIIAKLNEMDSKTRRANVFTLVDKLYARAVAGKHGDLFAMKEIFDRAEGRVLAAPAGEGDAAVGGVHVHVTVEGGIPDDA